MLLNAILTQHYNIKSHEGANNRDNDQTETKSQDNVVHSVTLKCSAIILYYCNYCT